MDFVLSPNKRRRECDNFLGKSHPVFSDMETKSISDILTTTMMENPYEVVRKPPKKKKKSEDIVCFDNAGLNLETPEKQFNPFEVRRTECDTSVDKTKESVSYVNLALNLKAPENSSVKNPFEIERPEVYEIFNVANSTDGIVNPALDLPPPIAIGVPFTPSVNRRIAFHQLKTPPNSMTPSEMLSKALRFTPEPLEPRNNETPRRSVRKNLSVISEEAINIEEELDCYQLELENSMNEAKSVNRKYFADIRKSIVKKEHIKILHNPPEPDVIYEGDEIPTGSASVEEEFTFRNPQTFQRAYRRPCAPPQYDKEPTKAETEIKSSIRRSIRKLTNIGKKPKKPVEADENDMYHEKKEKSEGNSLISSIRQSLRLKRKVMHEQENIPQQALNTTIIETDCRKIFREYQEPSGNPFVRKNTLRRSTRQVLKNVFKKNVEGYELDISTK
ncbi:hypothetical protein DMENIID0001_102950 [Sergentomyia squamirostris]